ncbi:MAG TPA: hypothetical protein VFE35_03105 [Candidatus Cybelea sp.]|nr:hypothetical protein [Candidatus Cybelea sp.]
MRAERQGDDTMAKGKQPGLDCGHRDVDGRIREKRDDTRIDTLRESYGEDFARRVRGVAHLGTLLDRSGADSLSDYFRNH